MKKGKGLAFGDIHIEADRGEIAENYCNAALNLRNEIIQAMPEDLQLTDEQRKSSILLGEPTFDIENLMEFFYRSELNRIQEASPLHIYSQVASVSIGGALLLKTAVSLRHGIKDFSHTVSNVISGLVGSFAVALGVSQSMQRIAVQELPNSIAEKISNPMLLSDKLIDKAREEMQEHKKSSSQSH